MRSGSSPAGVPHGRKCGGETIRRRSDVLASGGDRGRAPGGSLARLLGRDEIVEVVGRDVAAGGERNPGHDGLGRDRLIGEIAVERRLADFNRSGEIVGLLAGLLKVLGEFHIPFFGKDGAKVNPLSVIFPLSGNPYIAAVDLNERIAGTIRRLQKDRGWSLEELGRQCDPPITYPQQVQKLVSGETQLKPQWLEAFAKAFDLEPWELVRGEPEPEVTLEQPAAEEFARGFLQALRVPAELGKVIGLGTLLAALVSTLARHPAARSDPQAARLATDLLVRHSGGQ